MDLKMLKEEKILKEGGAGRTNYFNTQGGKLYFTNKRLVFIGHGFNFGDGSMSMNLEDILAIRKACTWTIYLIILPFPNAFRVVLKDGKNYKFSVFGRRDWLSKLKEA